jgi:hypothetical protein
MGKEDWRQKVRIQKAEVRRQEAGGRRQKAGGRSHGVAANAKRRTVNGEPCCDEPGALAGRFSGGRPLRRRRETSNPLDKLLFSI